MNTTDRTRTYRAKLIAAGQCVRCRRPQDADRAGKCLCRRCNGLNTRAARIRKGSKPWRKGRPGRPPLGKGKGSS